MSVFDDYFLKKDNLLRRRVEIDSSLYEELENLKSKYGLSIYKLINIAIYNALNSFFV